MTKAGQRVMKWDTVSGSLWHSGQSSLGFLLARDVANIFKSVLSLVYRRRMSGFRSSFIYLGTTYSFDKICLVANRVDDAMEFLQTWMNWSFRRFYRVCATGNKSLVGRTKYLQAHLMLIKISYFVSTDGFQWHLTGSTCLTVYY